MSEPPRASHESIALLLGAAVSLTLACGGGADGGGTPPTPTITISLSSASASVQQGASVQLTATVTGAGGFTGTPGLNVTGAPAGVIGAISNLQTNGATTTATVTITVAAGTTVGAYTLSISGNATGVSSATTPFALTVTAAQSYSISLQPTALIVAKGANGTTALSVARTNFAGSVTLSAENLPGGVTAAFSPNPATTSSSTLTLAVASAATAGTTTITIRGTATGLADQTVTLSLAIPGPAGTLVSPIPNEGWAHTPEGSAVTYVANPPASGTHYPVWARYELYTTALGRSYWVHNLEHGAIVMLYRPDTPAAVVAALSDAFRSLPIDPECGHARALLTPDPLLPSPRIAVVAADWLLTADGVDEPSIRDFVLAHRNRAPENVCLGGTRP